MELQRHASILIRQSNELLQLAGKHDGGAHNDQAIREQIATMHARLNDLTAQLTPKEVLQEQALTLPIEQVSGNMKIVRDTIDGEWE